MKRLLKQSDFENYHVVTSPPRHEFHCWAGAPDAVYDPAADRFYIVYRVREPERRGFEARIDESADGINFTTVKTFSASEFYCPSIERSAILKDPKTGLFKLYLAVDHRPWRILKLDDVSDVRDFNSATARPVLEAAPDAPDNGHVKDPFIFVAPDGLYRMYYIGHGGNREETYLATSRDGETWERSDKNPIMKNCGWHDFFTRPACLLPLDDGYAFYYEGSGDKWFDKIFNVQTGVGFTTDLETIEDRSPEGPALMTSTPGGRLGTLRYLSCVEAKGKVFAYYEAARPDDSHELRVSVIEE